MVKSNQGNQDFTGNQKNVIQGQRPDRENTQQRTLNNQDSIVQSNSDSTKNWGHGSGALVG